MNVEIIIKPKAECQLFKHIIKVDLYFPVQSVLNGQHDLVA